MQVQKSPDLNFQLPIVTEDQKELFSTLNIVSENKKTNCKPDMKNTLSRVKELQNVLNQIKRSTTFEMNQYLKGK